MASDDREPDEPAHGSSAWVARRLSQRDPTLTPSHEEALWRRIQQRQLSPSPGTPRWRIVFAVAAVAAAAAIIAVAASDRARAPSAPAVAVHTPRRDSLRSAAAVTAATSDGGAGANAALTPPELAHASEPTPRAPDGEHNLSPGREPEPHRSRRGPPHPPSVTAEVSQPPRSSPSPNPVSNGVPGSDLIHSPRSTRIRRGPIAEVPF